MKIGIFAGTFDPIHSGHIAFAQRAVSEGHLDKVVIVAEKNPYRKKPYASWDHRQAMIEHATEDISEADHDYNFSSQLAHQYTIENMLSVAKKHYGEQAEIWFLVGSDVFEHMDRWKDVAHRTQYGGFIVALRNDHTEQWLQEKLDFLEKHHFSVHVQLVKNYHTRVSSNAVRRAVQGGETPLDTLPNVATYIEQHNLYEHR